MRAFARDLVQAVRHPLLILDADFRIVMANPLFCQSFATQPAQTEGRALFEVAGGKWDDSALRTLLERVISTGEPFEGFELNYESSDKGHRRLTLHGRLMPCEAEDEALIFLAIEERTVSPFAEELSRTSQLLRAVAQSSPDAIFVKDRAGQYLLFNEAAARFVGRRVDEVLGRDDSALFDPDRARLIREHDRQVMDNGEILSEEEELTAAGVTRVYQATKAPYRDDHGNVIGLIGISRDITERKRIQEALRLSEELYRLLLERIPDPMFVYDRETLGYLAVNDAAIAIYGFGREEFLRMTIKDIRPEEDIALLLERVSKSTGGFENRGLWRHRKKDGTVFEVEITAHDFQLGGRPASIIIARDITDRRRAEANLKKVEEQFRQSQKMEAIGQLAGGVAHDFNNLLTIINGYSSLLLQSLPKDDPSRSLLAEIYRAGERSAGLTRQLLAFSRKQVMAPRVLDINVVVVDAEKMLRRMIGEDVRLTTALEPNLGAVMADPGLLEQVLLNLAVNARDAMPTGGQLTIKTGNVELDETFARTHPPGQPGQHVCLSISDTGSGMTAEVMAHIFEPFFTTKGQGKGTGLGLATVFGIVQQSGGMVDVYSEVGVGTTFKIYLPRIEKSAGSNSASGIRIPPRGTETILLVEDEAAVRALARHILTGCGYSVLEASNGDQALRRASEHNGMVQLLVTDVVMPGLGGRVVAQRMQQVRPDMKVLFMSGYTDDAIVRHGILSEQVNFLQKPFSPLALACKVREVLDKTPR